MKKCMLAAISIQGKESTFLNLTTLIHYGGQKQFTTECIILDKALMLLEVGVVRKTSCYLELTSIILDYLTSLSRLMYLCCVCKCVCLLILIPGMRLLSIDHSNEMGGARISHLFW